MGKVLEESKFRPSKPGEPVWELLRHYPVQGKWTEEEYLRLDEGILIEYTDGVLEFLTMPTMTHQQIVLLLVQLLQEHLKGTPALVLFAPLPVKVADGKYREPDVLCMLDKADPRVGENFWTGADVLFEVVSQGKEARERDYDDKSLAYAKAGVSEYWIVDPIRKLITVKSLRGKHYVDHSTAKEGQTAESALLPGFTIEADRLFQLK